MAIKNFSKKEYFVFDAFGTLFQTSTISDDLKAIAGDKVDDLLQTWRRKQLEYSWLRNQMDAYVPFGQVTKEALDFSMRKHGLRHPQLFDLMLIYNQPSLIDGAFEALNFLKEKNKTVCILSNGTRAMLENGVKKTGIENIVDHLFTVDDIQIYKPRKEVYQMALSQLGAFANDVLFFSSNQWDVSGASTFGLDSVWVNQYGEVSETLPFGSRVEVDGLPAILDFFER